MGDGSESRPFRTLARARQIIEASAFGDIAILFRRGDVWRESVGVDAAAPNITLADWGPADEPKPVLTPFASVGPPAAWTPVDGSDGVYVREIDQIATWVKEDDDYDRPYSRQSSLAGVHANPGSWWWKPADPERPPPEGVGLLYVHPKHDGTGQATDPRVDGKPYEFTRPTDAGLIVRGDGSRIQNIKAVGWGMQERTPSQQHGIESRAKNRDRVAILDCEAYYGSSHAMVHAAAGAAGGITTFVRCRAGLTSFNGTASETVFNTFAYQGGQETIFHECVATQGTLPSSEWNFSAAPRGRSFYGHTGGASVPFALFVSFGCRTLGGPRGCQSPTSVNDLPVASSIEAARGVTRGETFIGGDGSGPSFGFASRGMARVNCVYDLTPAPGASLASYAQNGWVVNTVIALDLKNQTGRYSLFNGPTNAPSTVHLWHSAVLIRSSAPSNGAGVSFSLDYDRPTQSVGSSVVNSVLSNSSVAAFEVGLGEAGSVTLCANAYHGVQQSSYRSDPRPIALPGPAVVDAPRPDCDDPVSCGAADLPGARTLGFDVFGPADRRTIGPIERIPCGDFNADGIVDFFDFLDFAGAFGVEDTSADINRDGQVDFFDYLDFVGTFGADCAP